MYCDADVRREDERGQRERRRHLDELRAEQHVAAIVAIGDDAADQREQQDRQLAEEVVEAEIERRVGQLEDEPRLGDLLHPVADGRGEGAEPQHAEIAVVKGGERAADDGMNGSRAGPGRPGWAAAWTTPLSLVTTLRAHLIPAGGAAYTRGGRRRKSEMRAALESLLRARKLDVTLTTRPAGGAAARSGWRPTGLRRARRGARRRPAPRSSVGDRRRRVERPHDASWCRLLAAATARGEAVGARRRCDTFDPASAAARGVDLPRVLWVRERRRRRARAEGVLADPPGRRLRPRRPRSRRRAAAGSCGGFPGPTWMRMARIDRGKRHGGAAGRRAIGSRAAPAASRSRSTIAGALAGRLRRARACSPASIDPAWRRHGERPR